MHLLWKAFLAAPSWPTTANVPEVPCHLPRPVEAVHVTVRAAPLMTAMVRIELTSSARPRGNKGALKRCPYTSSLIPRITLRCSVCQFLMCKMTHIVSHLSMPKCILPILLKQFSCTFLCNTSGKLNASWSSHISRNHPPMRVNLFVY